MLAGVALRCAGTRASFLSTCAPETPAGCCVQRLLQCLLEQTSDAVLVIGPPPEITVSACSAQLASLVGCRAEVRSFRPSWRHRGNCFGTRVTRVRRALQQVRSRGLGGIECSSDTHEREMRL